MNLNELLLWLVAGLLPYCIESRCLTKDKKVLEVHALFWFLAVHSYEQGRYQWILHILLIRQLRSAVQSILIGLQRKTPPQL